MTTAPERSVPKVIFTDAEAGAKVFPDSTNAGSTTTRRPSQADALRGRDRWRSSRRGTISARAGCTGLRRPGRVPLTGRR